MTNLPVSVPRDFRIIAHRGASRYAPENTLAAFRLAERIGAVEIELDVQFSRDCHLVICHDSNLARYGYPGLSVADLNLADLLALDMGSWFSPYLYGGEPILAFDTLLAIFRNRFTYHVEIKSSSQGLIETLLDTLSRSRLTDRTIVTSFDFESLCQVRSLSPDLRIGWLLREGAFTAESIAQAASVGCFQICPRADETSGDMVAAGHDRLPEVRAHHVTGVGEMMQAIETGCDGMTIDWPDWLIHEKNGGKTS